MHDKNTIEIYGTFGPSCDDDEILYRMFLNGMTGMRLNLSHKSLDDSKELINKFYRAAEKSGVSPKLLIDMQGPELRIGSLKNDIELKTGDNISLGSDCIPVSDIVLESISDGSEILLDDGKILLKALKRTNNGFICNVIRGGILKSRKSILVKNANIHAPTMTDMDIENISKADFYGVTGVMQPFVRDAEDLRSVRKCLISSNCKNIELFAKIENLDGVTNLNELLPECDEIVIARGDLGNSMNLWEVPKVQKKISSVCNDAGKRFMVVTQMLSSMENNPVPTRAEVSDIYNAVLDGASSVMVTGETAIGKYPVEVIKYLYRTTSEALNNG